MLGSDIYIVCKIHSFADAHKKFFNTNKDEF
jgi:hypothetical protein